jgi:tripeptidyl-peptidase-1
MQRVSPPSTRCSLLTVDNQLTQARYLKLGLQGVTVLYSSGDNGVAGYNNQCCLNPGCASSQNAIYTPPNAKYGTFSPSFPSTCPYITSVGATQILPGASVTAPEEACETVIYSGGGFSNVFSIPSYQVAAQKYYFAHNSPDYTAAQYNKNQKARGYPDLAANGANYPVYAAGDRYRFYGTSASSPVVGSIITLINNQRAKAGKTSVGFINPTIYQNTQAFNDIKRGGNRGCGTSGFRAVTGWDPVTGLGTPDYEKLLKVFMALP